MNVVYSRELGRGIDYSPRKMGGGTYARCPVWETLVLVAAILIVALPVMLFFLVAYCLGIE